MTREEILKIYYIVFAIHAIAFALCAILYFAYKLDIALPISLLVFISWKIARREILRLVEEEEERTKKAK